MASCDFCEIAAGRADAEVVAEGDRWVAFFPLEPATPGHTLVIPKEHVKDLWDASLDVARDLMGAVVQVGRAINSALQPDGMNLISSAGRAAEQTVPHLHLHVVPRWSADGFGEIWPSKTPTSRAVKEDAAKQIRAAYSRQLADDGGDG
jgi:histidine triad (HIT) family protein